jgi:hypothetical protein
MPQITLPIELCLMAIENLDVTDDITTLTACSLTCKAFLPASRRGIFARVDLNTRGCRDNGRVQKFMEIVDSSPIIGSYVRHLWINEGLVLVPEDRWTGPALPFLATHLRNVEKLEISGTVWNHLDDNAHAALLSGFLTVTTLWLYFNNFGDSLHFKHLLSSFPKLTELDCHRCDWDMENPSQSSTPLASSLTKLDIDSGCSELLYELMELQARPAVRVLQCNIEIDEPLDESITHDIQVGRLLKILGSGLEELSIFDDYIEWNESHNGVLDFKPCPTILYLTLWASYQGTLKLGIDLVHNNNLRFLDIRFQAFRSHLIPAWLLRFLSQPISPKLEHIVLRADPRFLLSGELDWHNMQPLLGPYLRPGLKTFTMIVINHHGREFTATKLILKKDGQVLQSELLDLSRLNFRNAT